MNTKFSDTILSKYSNNIKLEPDGIYYSSKVENISYPHIGNNLCFDIEEQSFWFKHRNNCIVEMVNNFQPIANSPIFDVGGGNGFVAQGLINAGYNVVLVEPGLTGAKNAKKRGLQNVVCATTNSAKFKQKSLPAIGIFDVIEHIREDYHFLKHLGDLLCSGGMLYLTVPSFQILWSHEDVEAGHFRRYTLKQVENKLLRSGFEICYSTYIFKYLPIAVGLYRSLPFRLGFRRKSDKASQEFRDDHIVKNGLFSKILDEQLRLELGQIIKKNKHRFGSSCMIAAKKR